MSAHPIFLLLDNLSIGTVVVGGRVFDFVNNRRFHVLRLFQNQSATASGFLKKKIRIKELSKTSKNQCIERVNYQWFYTQLIWFFKYSENHGLCIATGSLMLFLRTTVMNSENIPNTVLKRFLQKFI